MTASIRSIGTAVPATRIEQSRVRDLFAAQPDVSRLGARLIGAAFDASGIVSRHTVLAELDAAAADDEVVGLAYDPVSAAILRPTTAERNALYVSASRPLLVGAAREAIAGAPGVEAADITHVVTVSCTGFYAPGPDYVLVRELGLAPSTRRLHIGFMGCYGAFPALRAASAFCAEDAEAVVLVVCVELCTLHIRSSNDAEQIVASSVFADGAAAAIVSARSSASDATDSGDTSGPARMTLELTALESVLTDDGEADMAWTIGDQGFDMTLSSYVPSIVGRTIGSAVEPLLAAAALDSDPSLIEHWAVHPGGRSILDKVEHALELSTAQMRPSRSVLERYGNMSSATVLFVLKDVLAELDGRDDSVGERVCALAFGPGLTVESAVFTATASGRG